MILAGKASRAGSAVIMLLVVLLLIGLLTQQTVRTLWILRRSQDHQFKIQQAKQLLELGLSLDRQSRRTANTLEKLAPLIVKVGDEYGRLEVLDQSSEGGLRSLWVAKLPVDVNGAELPHQVAVAVSCERSR